MVCEEIILRLIRKINFKKCVKIKNVLYRTSAIKLVVYGRKMIQYNKVMFAYKHKIIVLF